MSAQQRGTAGSAALERRLAATLEKYDARPDTGTVRFALESPGRGWSWDWESPAAARPPVAEPAGAPSLAGQYFIASTTKLYVTALVMQLRAEGRLDLRAPAATYLDPALLERIHVLGSVDSSERVTVEELLAHTSGIADYFEQRRAGGTTQIGRALEHDFSWTLGDVLRITRDELEPRFAPSSPGKAFYSDTNYQLLGALVEAVTGQTYEEALRDRVLEPLGLEGTYPFTLETSDRYADVDAMLYGTRPIVIPKAMASVRADGGIVSTARDGIAFLEAFMGGRLFPAGHLGEMQRRWNPIFRPLEYGVGLMRFALPRYYTLGRRVPPMVGHSGASGAVLYFVPELELYVSGTVNQVKKRSLSYNLLTRLVMACQSATDAKGGWS
jgi:CubicO group peptidase (beta-lactamase class C family)